MLKSKNRGLIEESTFKELNEKVDLLLMKLNGYINYLKKSSIQSKK
jgi:hypothetical protein